MPRRRFLSGFLHFLIIAAAVTYLGASTWSKTADIGGDFGMELYAEWFLSKGHHFYRDIAYYFGPLPPLVNSLVMHLFGPNLNVILAFNLLILLLAVAILHHLLRITATAATATACVLFFLFVFALSSPLRLTDYNFLTPYVPHLTHGFLLALLLIFLLHQHRKRNSALALFLAGVLVGMSFLIKPEIFLPCASLFIVGSVAILWTSPLPRIVHFLIGGAAIFVAPALALICFTIENNFSTALSGILGGLQFVPQYAPTPFYNNILGTDHLGANALIMFYCAAIYLSTIFLISLCAILIAKITRRRVPSLALSAILAAICFFCVIEAGIIFDTFWLDLARGFPIVAITAVILSAKKILVAGTSMTSRLLVEFSLAIIALMFLPKMFFNTRIWHYGFVLAAPCGILLVLVLLDRLPAYLHRWALSAVAVRFAAVGILSAVVFENLTLTHRNLSERSIPLSLTLGGTAWERPANANVVSAIRFLQSVPGDCAILPGGQGIDFAAAKIDPLRYFLIDAFTVRMLGEQNMIADFAAHPPHFVLIREIDQQFAGARFFGYDFGKSLYAWIKTHYRYDGKFTQGDHPIELWTLEPQRGVAVSFPRNH